MNCMQRRDFFLLGVLSCTPMPAGFQCYSWEGSHHWYSCPFMCDFCDFSEGSGNFFLIPLFWSFTLSAIIMRTFSSNVLGTFLSLYICRHLWFSLEMSSFNIYYLVSHRIGFLFFSLSLSGIPLEKYWTLWINPLALCFFFFLNHIAPSITAC